MSIRVLIVDDHRVVRQGLRMFLSSEEDIDIVGEASDGEQALAQVEKLLPDVVLMDLLMPGLGGVQATAAIRKEHPQVEVVALTSVLEDRMVVEAVRAGAIGYLLKDTDAEEVGACHSRRCLGAGPHRAPGRGVPSEGCTDPRHARAVDRARDRCPQAPGSWALQPGHRVGPGHRRGHGEDPRQQHPGQAGGCRAARRPRCRPSSSGSWRMGSNADPRWTWDHHRGPDGVCSHRVPGDGPGGTLSIREPHRRRGAGRTGGTLGGLRLPRVLRASGPGAGCEPSLRRPSMGSGLSRG